MRKNMIKALLVAVFVIAGSITVFASQTSGWKWINGYCYYFTDKDCRNKLVSCTTPDGYTVDEQGRWTENGVAQHNGYGNLVVGTDALYAGKNDTERYNAIMNSLANLYATKWMDLDTYAGVKARNIWAFNNPNNFYINVTFINYWNDSPEYYENNRSEVIEQTIKTVCGDHVGQELFNAIRVAAEPAGGGKSGVLKRDASGNLIYYYDEWGFKKCAVEETTSSGDGVNFALMDLNAWNGRKTDYGKTIYIEPGYEKWGNASGTPSEWSIVIK